MFAIVALWGAVVCTAACGDSDTGEGTTSTNTATDTGGNVTADIADNDAGSTATTDTGSTTTDTGSTTTTDTGSSTDGGATDPDTGADAGPVDAGANCPGGAFCDCSTNDDCDNGICIDTADGKKCAKKCVDNCPKGFTCNKYGQGDSVFVCTPDHLAICAPCNVDKDCKYQGPTALCLDYGAAGKFCGAACKADADCPGGYGCVDVTDSAGSLVKQCKLKDAKAECKCSKWAIAAAAKTTCSVTNDEGTCKGERGCGATGLGKCNATTPEQEKCDNLDNDCDGTTDNLDKATKCGQKAWLDVGSKTACKEDADCKVKGETCADNKTCRKLIGECPGIAECAPGGQMICKNAKTPKLEACNGDDDDCDGVADEDYPWENPDTGAKVPIGGNCGLGVCKGGTVKCDTFSKSVCDTEKSAKLDKEACNDKDDDCDGKVDEDACEDGNACTTDTCDGSNSKCSNKPAKDCDDKNQCTTDSCDTKTGSCVHKPYVGSCDDGNACSEGDTCKQVGTESVCAPGATTKTCDDSNVCTDDSCDAKGGCVNLPNAVTVVCYTAKDKNTAGVGECSKGVQKCAGGKLPATCGGEVLPSLTEACDGKDDDCNGKTDEGCKSANVDLTFAAAYAGVEAGGKKAFIELSGSSPSGRGAGSKRTVHLGFIAWVQSLLK